jgi:hypothetical protein
VKLISTKPSMPVEAADDGYCGLTASNRAISASRVGSASRVDGSAAAGSRGVSNGAEAAALSRQTWQLCMSTRGFSLRVSQLCRSRPSTTSETNGWPSIR